MKASSTNELTPCPCPRRHHHHRPRPPPFPPPVPHSTTPFPFDDYLKGSTIRKAEDASYHSATPLRSLQKRISIASDGNPFAYAAAVPVFSAALSPSAWSPSPSSPSFACCSLYAFSSWRFLRYSSRLIEEWPLYCE